MPQKCNYFSYVFKLWKPDYFNIALTDWVNVAIIMSDKTKTKTLCKY